jgi:enoyl-CoA hydratase
LVITIDRPAARNSVSPAVAEGIEEALDLLDGDDTLKVGVLTGAGGYFSAGMDLRAFAAGERPFTERGGFAGIVERRRDKVLIAAIEGFALAGGLEIALACDLIVAARGARLGIPEVKVGLLAAGGALLNLPRRIPYHLAMEMALTGEPITAEDGRALGLVNRLADPDSALEIALGLAREVAVNAPLALAASKRTITESGAWTFDEQWMRQAELAEPVFASADAAEGARAFVERRPPSWRGA